MASPDIWSSQHELPLAAVAIGWSARSGKIGRYSELLTAPEGPFRITTSRMVVDRVPLQLLESASKYPIPYEARRRSGLVRVSGLLSDLDRAEYRTGSLSFDERMMLLALSANTEMAFSVQAAIVEALEAGPHQFLASETGLANWMIKQAARTGATTTRLKEVTLKPQVLINRGYILSNPAAEDSEKLLLTGREQVEAVVLMHQVPQLREDQEVWDAVERLSKRPVFGEVATLGIARYAQLREGTLAKMYGLASGDLESLGRYDNDLQTVFLGVNLMNAEGRISSRLLELLLEDPQIAFKRERVDC